MNEASEIQPFYRGKTIFITGGSGLMGKVLVEKLLYSCSDLDKIYLLIRPKRGRTPDIRVDDMFKLPMFNRIRKEKPAVMKKLIAVQGDVSLENLGISKEQREYLVAEVNIVFHCAATLKLEAKLKDAIEMNTIGTASMLELAKSMKNLEVFVHLSTAFCHVDQEELGERVYDAPDDPHDVMRLVKWMDEGAIDLITPKLLEPHPNTYTYSKRLAETLVANEHPNLPCVIARPSIVIPAWQEPVPGWVDNLNGPVGLIVAAGKGVLRSMNCNANYHAEVIPVDLAINALISIAHKTASTKMKSNKIPVYNITQSGVLPITWGQVLEKGKKVAYEYPFEGAIWFPDGDIRANKFIHQLFVIFFHILPAYFIDFLMLIFRQKRFMVRIQKRISDGLEVLQYFTTREWIFHNTNLLILWGEMSPVDKRLFPIDFLQIDIMNYLKDVILGARQYCMKESLETLPKARFHHRILYIVHLTAVYSFYFGILYFVYKHFETARYCLDMVSDGLKTLPIVGSVLNKVHL
ncbi:putative fatty acyl-CoA reductase CG5065 [Venturia canescens]|uniref:putative fatty acyl-CoA reductase CG5065 n=1 Tax=Venturia canescens TaxID=32260 RepID=UPI001C9CF21D|nr:putative fatty acyl-CoA reductase CG5065 [Venturia canescens]XP_043277620.1 putative fatty acyl-CoA reductase CG5065 [Venturia canescens]